MDDQMYLIFTTLLILIKFMIFFLAGIYVGILYANNIQSPGQMEPFSQIRSCFGQTTSTTRQMTVMGQITPAISQYSTGLDEMPRGMRNLNAGLDQKTLGPGTEKVPHGPMNIVVLGVTTKISSHAKFEATNKPGVPETPSTVSEKVVAYDQPLTETDQKNQIPQDISTGQDRRGVQFAVTPTSSVANCDSPTCPSQVSINHAEPVRKEWDIKMSQMAKRTRNILLDVVHNLNAKPNPNKKVITLSIGDPCVFGNLVCPEEVTSALVDVINGGEYNGYSPSYGHHETREAVAIYLEKVFKAKFEPDDIMLFSGCSGALENTFAVLAEKGDNILIPRPDFSMYRSVMDANGIENKFYQLLPDQNWMVDIVDLESQIDSKTKAILVNNPSNPCGSVYTADHLKDILEVANKHKLPVVADEIYERVVFPGKEFSSMVSLGSDVPIFLLGGISKVFLVPGLRTGWVALHDPIGAMDPGIRSGLKALSSRIMGANTLVQGAMVKFLNNIPSDFVEKLRNTLCENAMLVHNMLNQVPGLTSIKPEGSLYVMVRIEKEHFPDFNDTSQFVIRLMEEESVFCLPGECFDIPFYLRITIAPPINILKEACERMTEFCKRHYNN